MRTRCRHSEAAKWERPAPDPAERAEPRARPTEVGDQQHLVGGHRDAGSGGHEVRAIEEGGGGGGGADTDIWSGRIV